LLFIALHKRFGRSGAGVLFLLGMTAASVLYFVRGWMAPHVLLLSIFGVIIGKDASQRVRLSGTLTISSVLLLVPLLFGLEARARITALRAEFPIVSLEDRLAYEETAKAKLNAIVSDSVPDESVGPAVNAVSSKSTAKPDKIKLSSVVKSRLKQDEDYSTYNMRTRMLRKLHDQGAEAFAVADGFGIGRRIRPHRNYITLPQPEPIPFEEPEPEATSYVDIDGFASRRESPGTQTASEQDAPSAHTPGQSDLQLTHQSNMREFLNEDTFGYAVSRQQVAGFEPHAFRIPAQMRGADRTASNIQSWSITRLELVSLLKFDEPRVYVSDALPNMEQLDQTETRPLSAFETESLPQLVTEHDVVIKEEAGEIRMLGSLRATTRCLKCHSVERGHLLGAFSYRLQHAR
jgi:hypothetical protein